ncbi:site-specific integrase [Ralstonia mannitolilytica]|uniref:site-specific integrase n=1 Tax=Ralstonia mannitolilytica TaxID=105219 RepID=UPI0028F69D76|nr:site-specific integrase [Ralstonia mannitolilytica]CAJ0707574.1 Tyrosine recombinase XerC [Ralstonia mannitolilytica]
MGTVSKRIDNKGAATFQAKVRRVGFPALSQTFPTREEAERWLFGIEASIKLRSHAAAKRQAEAKLAAELQTRPRLVADLLRRYLTEVTPKKKGANAEGYVIPVMDLALETGMRRGEMLGLRWWQVSFDGRAVQLTDTKNGSPRGVALSLKAIAILKAVQQMAYGSTVAINDPDERPVFPDVTPNALKLAFKRMLERAGVENFHFHDLRHEATSRFFEKGLSPVEVASITGHKDTRMLMRYTHLDASKLADKLDPEPN